jgi:allantoinase
MRLVLRGKRVVFPDGERAASIHVESGVIARIGDYGEVGASSGVIDAGVLVVAPGIVDTHVHVNEPGRTDWEGFDTATRAAAAGGITTVVDMPLNSVPATVNADALQQKRDAARGRCHVDVAFWGGVVPGNEGSIPRLIAEGVRGFKCFLVPSGVDEFGSVDEGHLQRALPELSGGAPNRRTPLLVHAELPSGLRPPVGDPREYRTFLESRPPDAESDAIDLVARLAAEFQVAAHIVHVSSREGVGAVARAQAAGLAVTAETCPHYLTFAADEIFAGATAYKCAPPIRDAGHRAALWSALQRGTLSMVASDHSPAPPSLKCVETGDFVAAWGGIASIELSLAVVWSGAVTRGFTPTDLARWMSEAPARLAGLDGRKGAIRVGGDADFVLWDPDAQFEVEADRLQQRHKITPYAGRTLRGVVRSTYVRGVPVWHQGTLANAGSGHLL